ncbi:hypothetical protein ACSBR1_031576 [Camellia fascicularis]
MQEISTASLIFSRRLPLNYLKGFLAKATNLHHVKETRNSSNSCCIQLIRAKKVMRGKRMHKFKMQHKS